MSWPMPKQIILKTEKRIKTAIIRANDLTQMHNYNG